MTFKAKALRLEWTDDLPVYWFDNSPFKSHFMNSLSTRFHHGEKFFITAMKKYRDSITDDNLKADVDEFIAQESWHRHVHKQYDRWLAEKGYPTIELEEMSSHQLLKLETTLSRRMLLTMTACLEHNTTILAEFYFNHPELLESMHPHFRQVWQWHAVEELEHKSVAMDLLIDQDDDKLARRTIQVLLTMIVLFKIFQGTIILLKSDKQLWKWRTLTDAINLFFNFKNGIVIKTFIPFFRFMRTGFHPKDYDHTEMLRKYNK